LLAFGNREDSSIWQVHRVYQNGAPITIGSKMFTCKQARKDQAQGEAENNEKNVENLSCSSLS
jgi:hypothetical protein